MVHPDPTRVVTNIGPNQTAITPKPPTEAGTPKLVEQLRAEHPEYTRLKGLWKIMGDVSMNRIATTKERKSYLPKSRTETDHDYNQRIALSAFLPETPALVSDFTTTVFSRPARRDFSKLDNELREHMQTFIDAAGVGEEPMERVSEQAARLAIIFGSVDALLDRSVNGSDGPPQIELFTPENRLDWSVGEDGQFKWVKYQEIFQSQNTWDDTRQTVEEYRIVTEPVGDQKGSITVYQVIEVDGKPPTVSEPVKTEYDFDTIPVRTLYWEKIQAGIGNPWVKTLVIADLKVFRQESDLTFDMFLHAHPILKLWLYSSDPEKSPVTEINYGGSFAIHLRPGGEGLDKEDAEYMRKEVDDLKLLYEMTKETRTHSKHLVGYINPDTLIKRGSLVESGVAMSIRHNQQAKNYARMSRAIQEWEFQISEIVIHEENPDIDTGEDIAIKYPDHFDARSVELLNEHINVVMRTGSKEAERTLLIEAATKIVGDGATAKQLTTIQQEVEEFVNDRPDLDIPTDPISFQDLSLMVQRLGQTQDVALMNQIRKVISSRLKQPATSDISKQGLTVKPGREISPDA